MKRKLIILIFFSVLFYSCRHSSVVPEAPSISFANDVNPILSGNCTQSGCHGQQEHEAFSLSGYESVIKDERVVAGKPHSSKIYQAIIKFSGEEAMPPLPANRLSDEQIKTIYLWILQGAKNN